MISASLSVVARLYGALVGVRNRRFDEGRAAVERVGVRVVSVGNCSAGGTGKTPFVQYVAQTLATRGLRTAIVSRGYGRTTRGEVVVSDGASILASATEAGDEPRMHAERLLRSGLYVPVIVHERKTIAARRAVERFVVQAVIVDDGFQHRQLHRDCDIVLVDRETLERPFVLPKGMLREPLESLRRADVICCMNGVRVEELRHVVRAVSNTGSNTIAEKVLFIEAETRTMKLVAVVGQHESGTEDDTNARYYAVSGIAKPERFFSALCSQDMNVVATQAFRDHHRYTERDVFAVLTAARKLGCTAICTTEKDAVKLTAFRPLFENAQLPLMALPVELVITSGADDFDRYLTALFDEPLMKA